jgi:hypothetical protein
VRRGTRGTVQRVSTAGCCADSSCADMQKEKRMIIIFGQNQESSKSNQIVVMSAEYRTVQYNTTSSKNCTHILIILTPAVQ